MKRAAEDRSRTAWGSPYGAGMNAHATADRLGASAHGFPSTALRAVLPLVGTGLKLVSLNYGALKWTLETVPSSVMDRLSRECAIETARHAARHVPAYRDRLEEVGIDPRQLPGWDELPETDKATYVDRWTLAERCLDGRIPLRGTTIDESSGSTGTAYNWVRSAEERRHERRMIGFFARYTFGDEPLVVLNAFSMGAWATGMTTALALEQNGLVKATGPSIEKILGTMRQLGTGYRYLIVGYPPFIKLLLDEGEREGFRQLATLNADFQEAMREYPALMVPIVELHARGTGPFAGDGERIKHRYVATLVPRP